MLPAYVKSPSKADNCPSLYNEIAPIIEYVLNQILSLKAFKSNFLYFFYCLFLLKGSLSVQFYPIQVELMPLKAIF